MAPDARPELTLHALAEEDLASVDPWFDDPETVARLGDRGWPRRLLGFAGAPGRHAFLARDRGEPVGLADVEEEPGAPGCAAIALVVAPARRRGGVALALLDALAGRPELAGVEDLVGRVEAGHGPGLALARAAGAIARGDGPDEEGFLHVERPLDPGAARAVVLEHRLLRPEVRRDPDAVRALLHPGFREVGASGATWDRESVLALLAAESAEAPAPVVTSDVRGRRLASEVVLVTYTAVRGAKRSHRSSVWLAAEGGRWQLRFHQGTPA